MKPRPDTVASTPFPVLVQQARSQGLKYTIGPFNVCLKTNIEHLLSTFVQMYGDLSLLPADSIADFHLKLKRQRGIRGFWRPQAVFSIGSVVPFEPYPYSHAFPLMEWGLNWCIALSSHQYLMLHSAVLEYKGQAVIFPAMPGSGKSTLCSALMLKGWRLLSDEFGLIEPQSGLMLPLPRSIPLKNKSIDVIRNYSTDAVMGPIFEATRKGDIAHVAPTALSLARQKVKVKPALVVFPQYQERAGCEWLPQEKSFAFTRITKNSFNYYLSQQQGFEVLSRIIQECDCYSLRYSQLDEAVSVLTQAMETQSQKRRDNAASA